MSCAAWNVHAEPAPPASDVGCGASTMRRPVTLSTSEFDNSEHACIAPGFTAVPDSAGACALKADQVAYAESNTSVGNRDVSPIGSSAPRVPQPLTPAATPAPFAAAARP